MTLPNVSKALGNITFNRLICPMLYRWPIDFMIKQFKFSRSDYLTQSLCKYLLHDLELQLNDTTRPDIIIPVPIHIKRYGTRRFNQATLIAEHLSHGLAIPLNTHFCKRQQFAFAQSQLGGDKRRKNLKRAFSAEPMLGIKRVAIVDDVITTGATVEALSRAIKHRNPHINIDVWTLAISDKNLGLD
ncbi:ComF family protein [Alteromonas sp. a30]|nr:ComF family protein [Alteromonas sp. a30]